MGHFKSVSKKKRFKNKIIFFILLILLINIGNKYIKDNIHIEEKYVKHFLSNFMQRDIVINNEKTYIEIPTGTQSVFYEEKEPIIYIYNTHQSEKYKYSKNNNFNLDYNVEFASLILKDYLEKLGIASVVEDASMSKILKDNNLKYYQSYKGSRLLLENSIIKYPSLKYFIDIHRDSSPYEKTTCQIDGKKYAKIMFVVGLEHDNYEKNKELSIKLNNKIKNVNESLSRGILEKKGAGVDGIYNQDFNENTILLEIGGQYNEMEEVNNTLKILADILYEYIMENKWKIRCILFLKYF